MAATMKHRRSRSKRNKTRGSNRYDKLLTLFKKIKKFGGSYLSNMNNSFAPSHMVTKDNPEYKGVKVISEKKK